MTPDIDTYAPLVEAVFGSRAADGARIPFHTADRGGARSESRAWLQAWGANLTDRQLEMLEAYGAYLLAAGEIDEAPAVCSWVSSDWLASVDPSRVSLEAYDC